MRDRRALHGEANNAGVCRRSHLATRHSGGERDEQSFVKLGENQGSRRQSGIGELPVIAIATFMWSALDAIIDGDTG